MADKATTDGYDVQMQTNHLSHFLLSKELYPALKLAATTRGEARVVNHSSGARFMPGTRDLIEPEHNGKLMPRMYGSAKKWEWGSEASTTADKEAFWAASEAAAGKWDF